MSSVPNANTSPELYVRKYLFANGLRYRLHVKHLAGKPDIVLPRFRTVVFVHGCFWHGHSCPRGKRPASNVKFWNAKIDGNMRRDKRNQRTLKSEGWKPFVIWECRLRTATEALLKRLRSA
jgi:DNA mismatch endonuclease (patch repair protein)